MNETPFTSSPLAIAGHILPGAALLAPMSGVTDHGFRKVAARLRGRE